MAELVPGNKDVTTAGTPEVLTTATIWDTRETTQVIIFAKSTNTGVVYITDMLDDTNLFPTGGLNSSEWMNIPVRDPRNIKIDVSVNGEGVDYLAM